MVTYNLQSSEQCIDIFNICWNNFIWNFARQVSRSKNIIN